MIRFATPWLLLFAVPIAIILLLRLRRMPSRYGGRRRLTQVLLGGAVVAVALALGGLELGRRIDRLAVVFVVDQSRSVGDTAPLWNALRRSADTMSADDKAGVVVFGAHAATDHLPTSRPALDQRRATVPRDATDIDSAIRRALADLPAEHNPRIVLISDGVETDGDAVAAAQIAAGRGVPIDVLPVERAPSREVAVERLQMPTTSRPGEPMELRVVTRATEAAPTRIVVRRDGTPIAETTTVIRPGADVLLLR